MPLVVILFDTVIIAGFAAVMYFGHAVKAALDESTADQSAIDRSIW